MSFIDWRPEKDEYRVTGRAPVRITNIDFPGTRLNALLYDVVKTSRGSNTDPPSRVLRARLPQINNQLGKKRFICTSLLCAQTRVKTSTLLKQ